MSKEQEDFAKEFDKRIKVAAAKKINIVVKDQYKYAFDILSDCETADLIPGIIGPPGVGKTLLLRAYAEKSKRNFAWITGDEGIRPSHLIGSYNPAIVLNKGFTLESFDPGPLLKSMVYGGVFGLDLETADLAQQFMDTLQNDERFGRSFRAGGDLEVLGRAMERDSRGKR